jgi:hypothetical protein
VALSSFLLHRMAFLSFELPSLKDLAIAQEGMLADWLAKELRGLEYRFKDSPHDDEIAAEHCETLVDELRMCESRFPQYMRSSNFLVSYGAIESGFHRLAKGLHRDGRSLAKPPDKYFYIRDAMGFFETVGVDLKKFESDWATLDTYRLVRNCIAHSSGVVNPADKDYNSLVGFVRSHTGASISETNRIVLESSWCSSFLDVGEAVARAICQQLVPQRGL